MGFNLGEQEANLETVSAVLDDAGAIGHDYSEFSSQYHVEHDRNHRGDGEGLAEDR